MSGLIWEGWQLAHHSLVLADLIYGEDAFPLTHSALCAGGFWDKWNGTQAAHFELKLHRNTCTNIFFHFFKWEISNPHGLNFFPVQVITDCVVSLKECVSCHLCSISEGERWACRKLNPNIHLLLWDDLECCWEQDRGAGTFRLLPEEAQVKILKGLITVIWKEEVSDRVSELLWLWPACKDFDQTTVTSELGYFLMKWVKACSLSDGVRYLHPCVLC